ncbi:hypothetical protein [Phenylobacterium sp.]|jgi:hypothetical protein|uniref:hypothetical protein n=1 Tax=Phenylobacterium sp. TaxID=1871053 RepID=UPI002E34154F|nr:hypothetical protein [Phenylobacterium sp.]HEX3365825.1 hypothetical protein [Phenylobacterium sp.]
MKTLLSLGLAAAAFMAAPAVAQTPPAPPPATAGYVELLDGHFGVFNTVDGKPAFKEADKVPNKAGQQYGWLVKLKTNKSTVRVREEIRLPAPTNTWGEKAKLPPGMTVAADNRSAVFERDVAPRENLIFNVWAVAAGDPSGDYVIRVTIDGQLRQFNFTVE